mgnify:FL=1
MNLSQSTTVMDHEWASKKRLEMSFDNSLSNAIEQMKHLKCKDLYALQSEWHEWLVLDFKELEIEWVNHWDEWQFTNS